MPILCSRLSNWKLKLVAAHAAQFVRPSIRTKESPLDDIFPPPDIMDAECCWNFSRYCLVLMIANITAEDSQDVVAIANEDTDTESPL